MTTDTTNIESEEISGETLSPHAQLMAMLSIAMGAYDHELMAAEASAGRALRQAVEQMRPVLSQAHVQSILDGFAAPIDEPEQPTAEDVEPAPPADQWPASLAVHGVPASMAGPPVQEPDSGDLTPDNVIALANGIGPWPELEVVDTKEPEAKEPEVKEPEVKEPEAKAAAPLSLCMVCGRSVKPKRNGDARVHRPKWDTGNDQPCPGAGLKTFTQPFTREHMRSAIEDESNVDFHMLSTCFLWVRATDQDVAQRFLEWIRSSAPERSVTKMLNTLKSMGENSWHAHAPELLATLDERLKHLHTPSESDASETTTDDEQSDERARMSAAPVWLSDTPGQA